MLKIKDSVNLKELEKFGFELNFDVHTGEFDYAKKHIIEGIPMHSYYLCVDEKRILLLCISVNCTLREHNSNIDDLLLDNIYDLIKADMVEKVEECENA